MAKIQTAGSKIVEWAKQLRASAWLFPVILTVILLGLTVFKISGTSAGAYHSIFYPGQQDSNLLVNRPREIRSDEWIVNTPMTLAQKEANFAQTNTNIGQGQDMSVVIDVPYKDWSQIFRPHNLSFFVLPFDYAFSFKWWLMAYLLALSCYFFVLALVPGKRMFAAALSLALVFGGMIQWWYQFITIAPVYYSLFIATAAIYILRVKQRKHLLLWGAALAYLIASFALVLYPPFQIACGFALAAFLVGYLLSARQDIGNKSLLQRLGLMSVALVIATGVVLAFANTRSGVINAITNTAYPGERVEVSGGFDPVHTFAGHTQFMLQATSKAKNYFIEFAGTHAPLNQSEASNFILLLPFLLLPSLYIIIQDYRAKRRADWPLITVNAGFLLVLCWLFIPQVPILGKLFFFEKVQLVRFLLGLGLFNLLQLVLVARRLPHFSGRFTSKKYVVGYAILVFAVELLLGALVIKHSPGYLEAYQMVFLSIPVPVIIYLLLRKQLALAAIGFLAFSVFTAVFVNPLYRGTTTYTETPIARAIKTTDRKDPGRWASELSYLANLPPALGVQSVTGTFTYPQPGLWRRATADPFLYNRYANTTLELDRNPTQNAATNIELVSPDRFIVHAEACSSFVHRERIRYVIAGQPLNDSCAQLVQSVNYSQTTYFIYKLDKDRP